MNILEMQVDALLRCITADNETDRKKALADVKRLSSAGAVAESADPELLTRSLLLELGSPDHLVGHPYAIQAILWVIDDSTYINNISFLLYPSLAAKFDTTASRVERAIRHLVEVTWTRGNPDVLYHYFGNTISADKGKPTNGEFIARCANIIKLQLLKNK